MKSFAPLLIGYLLFNLTLGNSEAANPFNPPNFPLPQFKETKINVKDCGAMGNGTTEDTAAINQAIEKCSTRGGGDVVFPAGKYEAASIHIKSNVRLVLDPEAVITGVKSGCDPSEPNAFDKYQDVGHSHFHNSLFWGENIENFAIVGGKISGANLTQMDPNKPTVGDKVIAIRGGKNLLFQNVTHTSGAHFVYLLNDCENITFDHVNIQHTRDAVDFMGCRNVQVHDCKFTECSDDTIGVKSDYALGRKINSANVYVWDSEFASGCNGLQFGSETAGDFTNINFWNIKITRAFKAGISITTCDGGVIDGVNYNNIEVTGATTPIYIMVLNRLRTGEPGAKVGAIRNVKISNVTITHCTGGRFSPHPLTTAISGRPESCLENITFENVKIVTPGDGTAEMASINPPYPKDYSPKSLGPRPCWGCFIRHVRGLTFRNVDLSLDTPDQRPALVISDADGLTFDHVRVQKTEGVETVKMDQVKNFAVTDSPGLMLIRR